jgi:hypothetical protein
MASSMGVECGTVGEDLDPIALFQSGLARRFDHVHEVVAGGVDLPLDVIGDMWREEDDDDQPCDEQPANDRQITHKRLKPVAERWCVRRGGCLASLFDTRAYREHLFRGRRHGGAGCKRSASEFYSRVWFR